MQETQRMESFGGLFRGTKQPEILGNNVNMSSQVIAGVPQIAASRRNKRRRIATGSAVLIGSSLSSRTAVRWCSEIGRWYVATYRYQPLVNHNSARGSLLNRHFDRRFDRRSERRFAVAMGGSIGAFLRRWAVRTALNRCFSQS